MTPTKRNKKGPIGKKKTVRMMSSRDQKSCFCSLNKQDFECKKTDWDEILAIPGIADFVLRGNDSEDSIPTSKLHLLVLGRKFESVMEQSKEAQLDYPISVVRLINNFALTGELHCDESQLAPLLQAAKEFKISGIQKFGSDLLISMINDENVLRMYRLADEFLCTHVYKRVEDYILASFQELAENPNFLPDCSSSWLEKWMKADDLNADEETLCQILNTWGLLSSENKSAFQSLAKNIRFHLLNLESFRETVLPNLDETLAGQLEKTIGDNGHNLRTRQLGGSRLPYELVFAVGGFDKSPLGTMEVFDVRSEKWHRVSQSFPAHAYHGAVVTQSDQLVVFGGFGQEGEQQNTMSFSSSTFFFDLHSKIWTKRAAMIDGPRCYVSTAELNGEVFLMGGSNGDLRLRTVEKYSFRYNEFLPCKEMQEVANSFNIFLL